MKPETEETAMRFVVWTVLIVVLLLAAVGLIALSQTFESLESLVEGGGWPLLALVFLFGALGGLVAELMTLRGRIELPHRTEGNEVADDLEGAMAAFLVDLGVFARMFIGGAAGLVVLWTLEPDPADPIAVIASAILAGAAGGAVFETLRNRLDAALAETNLARSQELMSQTTEKLDQIEVAHQELWGTLKRNSESLVGATHLEFSAPASLELEELERIDTLIGEARALSQAAAARGPVLTRTAVRRVLAEWARVPLAKVSPDIKKISRVWRANAGNPQLQPEHLGDLSHRLQARFPGVEVQPDELEDKGGVGTVGRLIGHVERTVGGRAP